VQDLLSAWAEMPLDKPMDMRDWMIRYSLEISGRGACSYKFNVCFS
jgi:hypothetical protein